MDGCILDEQHTDDYTGVIKDAIVERNTYSRIRRDLLALKKASIDDTLGWIKEMFGTGTAKYYRQHLYFRQ